MSIKCNHLYMKQAPQNEPIVLSFGSFNWSCKWGVQRSVPWIGHKQLKGYTSMLAPLSEGKYVPTMLKCDRSSFYLITCCLWIALFLDSISLHKRVLSLNGIFFTDIHYHCTARVTNNLWLCEGIRTKLQHSWWHVTCSLNRSFGRLLEFLPEHC